MKLKEKQKVVLAKITEVVLFAFGISFGLLVLGFGFYMVINLLKSLFA